MLPFYYEIKMGKGWCSTVDTVLSVGPGESLSDEGPTLKSTLDFAFYIGMQYTNLFIFRFVS